MKQELTRGQAVAMVFEAWLFAFLFTLFMVTKSPRLLRAVEALEVTK